jgi:hypothetical protein
MWNYGCSAEFEMIWPIQLLASFILTILVLFVAPARAAAPYQGIYVVIDPYAPTQITLLQGAAQTACQAGQQPVTTPFCGAVNGILLRLPWCDFELYHVNQSNGQPYPSCHYQVGFSGAAGSPGVVLPSTDDISPCPGTYDICAGKVGSVLGATIRYIVQIDAQRATAGLPPLLLSVGMFAGIGTPESRLDSTGYVDVPHSTSSTGDPSTVQCYRLPLAWKTQFTSAYEQAFDQLLAYTQAQFPQGLTLTIVKVAPIAATDLEVEMPGKGTQVRAPVDPSLGGPGPVLNCDAGENAAQVWLDAYNANPINGETFSQANESAFGATIGHEWATLANDGLSNVIVGLATTNSSGFAAVDCGITGGSPCAVNPPSSGNWTIYYLGRYFEDLFHGGLSYTAAASAYAATRNDTFSISPSQMSINSTALSSVPPSSANQISCILNNTNPKYAPTLTLNSTAVQVLGVGSVVGWQTSVMQGDECVGPQYGQVLQNGISDGGLFLEVEYDAAFTNIAQCSPYLTAALNQLLSINTPTTCVY